MKLLILFSALAYVALGEQCSKVITDKCDQKILECCDSNLKTDWNITCNGKTIYNNPDCAENLIEDIYFTKNPLLVCDGYNKFRSCLGATARSCISYKHFLEQDAPLEQALTDQALYSRLNFFCGAGLEAYLRKFDAANEIFKTRYEDLRECSFEFRDKTRRVPSKACEYLTAYSGCLELIFQNVPELSWFFCEAGRVYGSSYSPHCDVSCSVTL